MRRGRGGGLGVSEWDAVGLRGRREADGGRRPMRRRGPGARRPAAARRRVVVVRGRRRNGLWAGGLRQTHGHTEQIAMTVAHFSVPPDVDPLVNVFPAFKSPRRIDQFYWCAILSI